MNRMADFIIEKVLEFHNITKKDLNSKRQFRDKNVEPRQRVCYLLRKYCRLSYAEIGREIGDKNHATVLMACRAVENHINTYKFYRREIEKLEQIITRNDF